MPPEPDPTPVFKTWRSAAAPPRGWPRRPAKAKKVAKPPAKKKGKAERDAFGYRKGTVGARINAVLSTTPRPVEALVRETGLTAIQVSAHLQVMIAKGHVIAGREGFATR